MPGGAEVQDAALNEGKGAAQGAKAQWSVRPVTPITVATYSSSRYTEL